MSILLAIFMYFVPTIIAVIRGHKSVMAMQQQTLSLDGLYLVGLQHLSGH